MENVTFAKFLELTEKEEGLVLLGTGGDVVEWCMGVTKILADEGIITLDGSKVFQEPLILTTTGGRVDTALRFYPGAEINMGKLAMWRIRWGDCSWISDYRVNYANQHGCGAADNPYDFDWHLRG